MSGKVTGPGIVPRVEPVLQGDAARLRILDAHQRPSRQKQTGYAMVTVTTVLAT